MEMTAYGRTVRIPWNNNLNPVGVEHSVQLPIIYGRVLKFFGRVILVNNIENINIQGMNANDLGR